jgi:hypothetical protein
MKGYCNSCKKNTQGVKKQISWGFFFLTFIVGGFIWYPLYRMIFVRRTRCPQCGLKISKKR